MASTDPTTLQFYHYCYVSSIPTFFDITFHSEHHTFGDLITVLLSKGFKNSIEPLRILFADATPDTLLSNEVFAKYTKGKGTERIILETSEWTPLTDPNAVREGAELSKKADRIWRRIISLREKEQKLFDSYRETNKKAAMAYAKAHENNTEWVWPTSVGIKKWTEYQLSKLEIE